MKSNDRLLIALKSIQKQLCSSDSDSRENRERLAGILDEAITEWQSSNKMEPFGTLILRNGGMGQYDYHFTEFSGSPKSGTYCLNEVSFEPKEGEK